MKSNKKDSAKAWFNEVMLEYNGIKPEGAIVLIEEKIKDIVYIHFQSDFMHYISPKDIFTFYGRQMVKEQTLFKHIKNRYSQVIQLPHDG